MTNKFITTNPTYPEIDLTPLVENTLKTFEEIIAKKNVIEYSKLHGVVFNKISNENKNVTVSFYIQDEKIDTAYSKFTKMEEFIFESYLFSNEVNVNYDKTAKKLSVTYTILNLFKHIKLR